MKYINHLSLKNGKQTGSAYGFMCPICGHTKKNRSGRTAYILGINSTFPKFYCHRCGYTFGKYNSFMDFLREFDSVVFAEYMSDWRKEQLKVPLKRESKNTNLHIGAVQISSSFQVSEFARQLSTIDNDSHLAKKYLIKRKIPTSNWHKIHYYYGNAYSLFKKIYPECDKYVEKSNFAKHEGLLVPVLNKRQENLGFVLRFLNPINDFRFLNLFANDGKMFLGEDNIDKNERIYVVEGLFDKLTFNNNQNVLAMLSTNPKLERVDELQKNGVTYIFDNEYNNPTITNNIKRVIQKGFGVFFWDQSISNVKDINDIKVKYGWDDKKIIGYLKKNTYHGLSAVIEFEKRKKIYNSRSFYY